MSKSGAICQSFVITSNEFACPLRNRIKKRAIKSSWRLLRNGYKHNTVLVKMYNHSFAVKAMLTSISTRPRNTSSGDLLMRISKNTFASSCTSVSTKLMTLSIKSYELIWEVASWVALLRILALAFAMSSTVMIFFVAQSLIFRSSCGAFTIWYKALSWPFRFFHLPKKHSIGKGSLP